MLTAEMRSTREGELKSPERQRLFRVLTDFLIGQSPEIPENACASSPFLLMGGWLHPVVRMETAEREEGQGGEIVGLRWTNNEAVEAHPGEDPAWAKMEKAMAHVPVQAFFS